MLAGQIIKIMSEDGAYIVYLCVFFNQTLYRKAPKTLSLTIYIIIQYELGELYKKY